MRKTIEKLISGMNNASIREDIAKDYYFRSDLVFHEICINFYFADNSDRKEYGKILKAIGRKKNLYVFFENSDYHGAAIGIIPAAEADDFDFYNKRRHICHDEFWNTDHEMRIAGYPDSERLRELDELHKINTAEFLRDLEERHKKIIHIA